MKVRPLLPLWSALAASLLAAAMVLAALLWEEAGQASSPGDPEPWSRATQAGRPGSPSDWLVIEQMRHGLQNQPARKP